MVKAGRGFREAGAGHFADPKSAEKWGWGRALGPAAPAVALTAFLSHLSGFLSLLSPGGVLLPRMRPPLCVPRAFASLLPVLACGGVCCVLQSYLPPVLQKSHLPGAPACGMIGPELSFAGGPAPACWGLERC